MARGMAGWPNWNEAAENGWQRWHSHWADDRTYDGQRDWDGWHEALSTGATSDDQSTGESGTGRGNTLAVNNDAHLLLARLRREALGVASDTLGIPLTGLSSSAARLGLDTQWKRTICTWDSALGIAEKITEASVDIAIRDFKDELDR